MAKNIQDNQYSIKAFLPTTKAEMKKRGWNWVDIILVTADAYVDHPSYGVALIGRWLESLGYRVAILDQPDWRSVDDFLSLGKPRLFWGITSGCVDAKLNDYASMGHKRKKDVYSPKGELGLRPAKPLLSYAARAKEAYNDVPIVLGGLGASLRRLVHYDYIEDKLKRSVLVDAKADLLIHGMGELAIKEIAERLKAGDGMGSLVDIPGTAYRIRGDITLPERFIELPSLDEQSQDSFKVLKAQTDYQKQCLPDGLPVVQDQGAGTIVVNPPARPLEISEIDALYDLPFTRRWHPKYDKMGGVPALESVRTSITSHRGCFGGCAFCSIFFHQGKYISSRSSDSIMNELGKVANHPDFKGTVQDVGGPSANMYGMSCKSQKGCSRASCLYPNPCKNLDADFRSLLKLMNRIVDWKKKRNKKTNVFIASGVRFDLANMSKEYISLLTREFVSGHLKVAPEHCSGEVLSLMGKPDFSEYMKFAERFNSETRKAKKEQYLVPYFISSHPGCKNEDALNLFEYLIKNNLRLRQVQDFTPVPLTLSTAMYVAEKDIKGKRLFVAKGTKAKKLQAALIQYWMPENRKQLLEFLKLPRNKKYLGLYKKVHFSKGYRK